MIKYIISKSIFYAKNYTTVDVIEKILLYLLKNIDSQNVISVRRAFLSDQLNRLFEGTIRYGPFKGFKFSESAWWGGTDRASMLLGIYEQELLNSLQQIPSKYRYFIDVGAADGYYGVGVIVGGLFEKSWCYEISEQGRSTIKKNSLINSVDEKIIIRGGAGPEFYKDFSENEASQSVLFVDIEGGEFELFSSQLFKKFRNSIIFIELHDWMVTDGQCKLNKLIKEAQDYFYITTLTTAARDLSVFGELQNMNDTDRWLICSEGRSRLMKWLRFDPK